MGQLTMAYQKFHRTPVCICAVRIDDGSLYDMIEAIGGGEKLEPQLLAESIHGVLVGTQHMPLRIVDALFSGKLFHRLGRIEAGIEAQHCHRETIFSQRFPGFVYDLVKVSNGGRADRVTTGIDQAQHQRFTAKIGH